VFCSKSTTPSSSHAKYPNSPIFENGNNKNSNFESSFRSSPVSSGVDLFENDFFIDDFKGEEDCRDCTFLNGRGVGPGVETTEIQQLLSAVVRECLIE
jgi:hypothetical protein